MRFAPAAAPAAPAAPRPRTAKAGGHVHARARWRAARPLHAGSRACAGSKGRSAFEPLLRRSMFSLRAILRRRRAADH